MYMAKSLKWSKLSFILSSIFIQYYYVLGNVLGSLGTSENKTGRDFCPYGVFFVLKEIAYNKYNK